jgi:hypothetical protein
VGAMAGIHQSSGDLKGAAFDAAAV